MNRFWKIVFACLGVVLLFCVGIGLSLNKIAKAALEKQMPAITQGAFRLEAIDLAPIAGSVSLDGLNVGSPRGYQSPWALSLGHLQVSAPPRVFLHTLVRIQNLEISDAEIFWEGNTKESNILQLLKNAQAYSKSHLPQSSDKTSPRSPKRFIIHHLILKNIKATWVKGELRIPIALPDIHLEELGAKEGGLPLSGLVDRLVGAISEEFVKEISASTVQKGLNWLQKHWK